MSFDEQYNETLKTLKNAVLPKLKRLGVAKLTMDYHGFTDDGQIDDVAYFDGEDQPVDIDSSVSELKIDDLLCEFLPEGFEVDLGGEGILTVDVAAGTVTLDHGEHVTEWSTSRWEV